MTEDSTECPPNDVAIKSLFLGPMAENWSELTSLISMTLEGWKNERLIENRETGPAISSEDREQESFQNLVKSMDLEAKLLIQRLKSEVPIYSSQFLSHMTFEASLPALVGHFATLLHNPNLITSEVSRQAGTLEDEAIASLVQMIGYPPTGRGHFTSGGTVANIEALWRARYRLDHWMAIGLSIDESKPSKDDCWMRNAHMGWERYYQFENSQNLDMEKVKDNSFVLRNPFQVVRKFKNIYKKDYLGPVLLVPANKHYSWQKGLSLLGYGMDSFWQIDLDNEGRLCVLDLEKKIEKARSENRPILMVVSVAGTTEMGSVDPIAKVNELLAKYRKEHDMDIWHHIDAAYGGFYCSLAEKESENSLSPIASQDFQAIAQSDSVTIDPHKLGYVPYACGAILVPNSHNYETSQFKAPYIKDTNDRWMKTLEGSRSATGAGAVWLSHRVIGFDANGIGRVLEKGIQARKKTEELLKDLLPEARFLDNFDTNIICFVLAKNGESTSQVSQRTQTLFDSFNKENGYFISKTALSFSAYDKYLNRLISTWHGTINSKELLMVRLVFMNPYVVSKVLNQDIERTFIESLKEYI